MAWPRNQKKNTKQNENLNILREKKTIDSVDDLIRKWTWKKYSHRNYSKIMSVNCSFFLHHGFDYIVVTFLCTAGAYYICSRILVLFLSHHLEPLLFERNSSDRIGQKLWIYLLISIVLAFKKKIVFCIQIK